LKLFTEDRDRNSLSADRETCEGAREVEPCLDERLIRFERRPATGRQRRICIRVFSNSQVVVTAPSCVSDSAVQHYVRQHENWIRSKLRLLQSRPQPVSRDYVSGEHHYWLGKPVILRVLVAPDKRQRVRLLHDCLEVQARCKSKDRIRKLLVEWYRAQAQAIFSGRLELLLTDTPWVESRPSLRVRAMRRRWGSCSISGDVTLNLHLLKAPSECVDYVILHELCHIAEHNHSPRFYRLLSRVLPEWKARKAQLDSMTHLLLDAD